MVLISLSAGFSASFKAFPRALNEASMMWWSSNPRMTRMCRVMPAVMARLLMKCRYRSSGQSMSA